jgi:hypothetical protein
VPLDYKVIIVCQDYSDYLRVTLTRNIKRTKEITVVTASDDRDTIKVCKDNGARIVISNRLGPHVAKGKAINDAIDAVDPQEWILLIDADILLPVGFDARLKTQVLDKDTIYYTRRWGPQATGEIQPLLYDFDRGIYMPELMHKYANREIAEPTRRHGNAIESRALGYFQLFNKNADSLKGRVKIYEEKYATAEMDDHIFGNFVFSSDKRCQLPLWDFDVIHLPHGTYTQNWAGRVTPRLSEAIK